MTPMPSSLTPRSPCRSWISCARATSASVKCCSPSSRPRTSQPAATQASSDSASRRTRPRNSRCSMLAPRCCSRAVISAGAPLAHEALEFGIGRAGKRHRKFHVLIASAPITTRYALALKSQHATAVGPLGYAHADGSIGGRHLDLSAEHGRAKRDRQLHANGLVIAGEKRVRTHGDFDQGIARRAAVDPGHPLAAQPQDLAFAGPGRDRNVEGGALGHGHLLLAAIDGIEEAEFEAVADILPG